MCKPHWTEYTRALRKASVARKATEATAALITEAEPVSEVQPVVDAEAEAPAASEKPEAGPGSGRGGRRRLTHPFRRTTGPGRTSGAFVRPVAIHARPREATPHGRPVAPTDASDRAGRRRPARDV